jgi:2-oxoglutarate dehydrogenase E1 component
VSPDWRESFDEIHVGHEDVTPALLKSPFQRDSIFHRQGTSAADTASSATAILQERLDQLIRNYRVRGHSVSQIDPLQARRPEPPELDPAFYGVTEEHMSMEFSTQWFGGAECRTLGEMLKWLQMTYCRSIGVHIDSLQVRSWLRDRMERTGNRLRLSREEQIRILMRLSDGDVRRIRAEKIRRCKKILTGRR